MVSACFSAVRLSRVAQGRTRLEVTDPDPRALPVLCQAADDDEAGRGLALLDALTLRWGVAQGAGAKTVWCELREEEAEWTAARPHSGQSIAFEQDVRQENRGTYDGEIELPADLH